MNFSSYILKHNENISQVPDEIPIHVSYFELFSSSQERNVFILSLSLGLIGLIGNSLFLANHLKKRKKSMKISNIHLSLYSIMNILTSLFLILYLPIAEQATVELVFQTRTEKLMIKKVPQFLTIFRCFKIFSVSYTASLLGLIAFDHLVSVYLPLKKNDKSFIRTSYIAPVVMFFISMAASYVGRVVCLDICFSNFFSFWIIYLMSIIAQITCYSFISHRILKRRKLYAVQFKNNLSKKIKLLEYEQGFKQVIYSGKYKFH